MNTSSDIQDALRLIARTGGPGELRGLNVPNGNGFTQTFIGWFDQEHLPEAAKAANDLDNRGASGVYVTLNPVNPAIAARACNRVKPAKDTAATGDADIVAPVGYWWLGVTYTSSAPCRSAGQCRRDHPRTTARRHAPRGSTGYGRPARRP